MERFEQLDLPGWLQSYQYEYDLSNYRTAKEVVDMMKPVLGIVPLMITAQWFLGKSKEIFEKKT